MLSGYEVGLVAPIILGYRRQQLQEVEYKMSEINIKSEELE